MEHFTQLNLQGTSDRKSGPKPATSGSTGQRSPNNKPPKKQHGTAKIVAIAGSLVAAALVTTLTLGTNACSKSSKPAIVAPLSPMASLPQTSLAPPPVTSSATAPLAAPKLVKKTARQSTFTTYKNADYGISFRYPKTYKLMKDDKSNVEWAGLGPVEMNFVQPGGTTLAAVQLPDKTYPGTDFASAFFSVAVNSRLTAKECEQFAFEDGKREPTGVSGNDSDHASLEPAKVKLGVAEYTEVESTGGESTKHADAKYYHVFQNGACYEFALGLETSGGKADAKPVDTNAVFGKLNWMLSTVKITVAGIPAKTAPALAATPEGAPLPTTTLTAPAVTTSAAMERGKN